MFFLQKLLTVGSGRADKNCAFLNCSGVAKATLCTVGSCREVADASEPPLGERATELLKAALEAELPLRQELEEARQAHAQASEQGQGLEEARQVLARKTAALESAEASAFPRVVLF